MSNKKISALSSASTPLTGSEIVPINQSSVTDSVSVANLTAGRSVSASDYVMSTGNLVPSTAGKGINFTANTPASGMTSQLLNWYEEGTWTPGIAGDGGSVGTGAYTSSGRYTRIGRQVTITGTVTFSNLGSWTGRVFITSVPFNASGSAFYGACWMNGTTISNVMNMTSAIGSTSYSRVQFLWTSSVGGGGDSVRFTNISSTTDIEFTLTYMV